MKQPNILWICTDQQRYDTIAALGNPVIKTPNLDALAECGIAFTHAYAQCTVCTPSRASFMTGMYPSTIRNCMNGNDRFSEAAPLISNYLRDAGYSCGLVGKLHLAAFHRREEPRPADDGFEHFVIGNGVGIEEPYGDWIEARGLSRDARRAMRGEDVPPELHHTTWCTDESLRFLEQAADGNRPWFLFASYVDPHPGFAPPQAYRDLYAGADMPPPLFEETDVAQQRRLAAIDFETPCRQPEDFDFLREKTGYYGMITLLDEQIGRLFTCLREHGLERDTLVVFSSDHGDMMGDHGLIMKGCRFYEGLVRVPLIFAWPERYTKGLRSDALVELTDIVPTLLDAAGVAIPERMQGQSLSGICAGHADPATHREQVRCEHYKSHWRNHYRGTWASMVRTRRWKQVSYHGHGIGELYDLQTDPSEFRDLWDDPVHADIRFELVQKNFDTLAFAVDLGARRVSVA